MTEAYTATIDRRFSDETDMWSLFDGLGERISLATSDIAQLVREDTWVLASDNSVTIQRPTLGEARAVLDAEDLAYRYGFYSMKAPQARGVRFGVYTWVDQHRIMVTIQTHSRVATEGIRVVLEKHLATFKPAPVEPFAGEAKFAYAIEATKLTQPPPRWHQRLWVRVTGGALLAIAVTVIGGAILKVLGLV